MDRYAGRPLLRLLDNYVLDIIGALPAGNSDVLLRVVRSAFPNTAGETWQEILENELHIGSSLRPKIHSLWVGYQEHTASQGEVARPEQFTGSFVDENFLPLIDKL